MSMTRSKEEAMLYYLFMMIDGIATYNKEERFAELCKSLELREADKQDVIDKCMELTKGSNDILYVIENENLLDRVKMEFYRLKDASERAGIVWNLIRLGFADGHFSEEERRIIGYINDRWDLGTYIYQEMTDTADTILTLERQKKWLLSTFEEESIRDEKEKWIDSEIDAMISDVKISINELTM